MAEVQFNPRPQAVRYRRSNLFVTVNTNWRPLASNLAQANRVANDLQNAIFNVIRAPGFKANYLRYKADKFTPAVPIDPSQVGSVDVKISVEVGQTMGYLHAHVFIAINHTYPVGGVQLDIPGFKAAVRAAGTEEPVRALSYIHVRGFGTVQDLVDYMFKDAKRDDPEAVAALADRRPKLIG